MEEGRSLKVRASFSVPESHKFDPVSVEFGLAFMNVGNEDQSFLLQGKKELVLTFVNKGYNFFFTFTFNFSKYLSLIQLLQGLIIPGVRHYQYCLISNQWYFLVF